MGIASDLRQSVLQAAMQGKLTTQKAEDGDAKDLLLAIREEKEKLVKEKKIKKEKPLTPITDEEIPFDIPENWVWCRLAEICTKLVDGDHNPPKGTNKKTPYIMASSKNINNDKLVNLESVRYLSKEVFEKENQRTQAKAGDIFFTSVGSLGRSCVYNENINICFQRSVSVITTLAYNYFLKYCFDSPAIQNKVLKEATGTAQKGFYLNQLAAMAIPLPPLPEQQRIVARVDALLKEIEELEQTEKELEAIKAAFPGDMKDSLLQAAMEGKLTTQKAEDGDAKDLLLAIREEKEKLVKEKKIKKEKPLTPITDEEIPFDIPENWVWCRLAEICTKLVDGDHNPPKGTNKKTPYIMASSKNINNDKLVNLESVRYLSKEVFEKENQRTQAKAGDIFFTSVGSLGRSCVYNENINICFQRSVSVITTLAYNYFLKYCFDSPAIQNKVLKEATGTAQKGFYLNQLAAMAIPLPPLAEQHRIVEKLDQLLPLCDSLSEH